MELNLSFPPVNSTAGSCFLAAIEYKNMWSCLLHRVFRPSIDFLLNNGFLARYRFTDHLPGDLEWLIDKFVEYYSHERYHESLNNRTPSNVFYGPSQQIGKDKAWNLSFTQANALPWSTITQPDELKSLLIQAIPSPKGFWRRTVSR